MKYKIKIKYKSGQTSEFQAEKIHCHSGKGGIDIFTENNVIPFFPGLEEETEEIIIKINN